MSLVTTRVVVLLSTFLVSGTVPVPEWELPEACRNDRPSVLVFLSPGCPVAELYAGRIAALERRFEPRGVSFLGLAPNARDSAEALSAFSHQHGLRFPFVRDLSARLAARLDVRKTPTVVVLDEGRVVRYRGRVDDQYAVGSRRIEPTRHDLAIAIEEVLAGKPVSVAETDAVGCPVDRPPAEKREDVTYGRDIAPIFARKCVVCHQSGEAGPFPLTTYAEVRGWADAIEGAVEDGRMPPWHASPEHGRFANDLRLAPSERAAILHWIEGGTPEGIASGLASQVRPLVGWKIQPDVVVTMPKPFRVPAQGVIDYQEFVVDPGFTEDRWIKAAEIRPGSRPVVHHCSVFLRAPGSYEEADAPGELGSYSLAAYVPGMTPLSLPDGMAKRIPAGWKLVFVIHYAPNGRAQDDQTCIGLTLADPKTVRREVATQLLVDPDLSIPPGHRDFPVVHTRRFDRDVLLLSMFPHMHLRGKSFRYEAVYPGGSTEILLDVPRYDFNWQNNYVLLEPKRLPAGTILRCTGRYDNSSANPANPDPNATVRAGKQSTDEMFNGYYDIALADEDRTTRQPRVAILVVLFGLAAGGWLVRRWTR